MAAQKQNYPSPTSIIYVLSIVLCGVGFLRVELELNEQIKRLIALETVAETKSSSKDPNIVKLNMNPAVFQSNEHHRKRRQADTTRNTTEAKSTVEKMFQINKLLSDLKPQLCQSKGDTCLFSLPGSPGPPGPRGAIGRRGRRGHKGLVGPPGMSGKQGPKGQKGEMGPTGKPGAKGDKGIMGSPGKSGEQGIIGPIGPQGDIGLKGQKGEIGGIGPAGKPGAKGDKGIMGSPGKSGKQGILGPVGLKGQQGKIGPIGMPGPKGERGAGHYPRDCSDLLKLGQHQSGEYTVNPDGIHGGHFTVYCDMNTDGGGWTVIQRRQDGSVDFYRGWNDYKSGFGQLAGEFWLGNDKIHRLTASRPNSLRVELGDWNGVRKYAKYGTFNIGDEQVQYRLKVGSHSGTAGDSLRYHNNMMFSTKDRDNDKMGSTHCAVLYNGGWWFYGCHDSNLNGEYRGESAFSMGAIEWLSLRIGRSLKFTEMKLKHLP